MDLASVLPLAFVMIAGPQNISAFFFVTLCFGALRSGSGESAR